MPTGQTIITNALTILGINEQGGTPGASDSVDALGELNAFWNAWGIDEGLIYAVKTQQFTPTTTVASYTIGNGATFNTTGVGPSRVYEAVWASPGNRNELKIVDQNKYFSHNDLTAEAATPDEIYIDYQVDPTTGFATVYLWPVPTGFVANTKLELEMAVPFSTWALATNQILPNGYQDAIQHALAWRLIPRFGQIIPQDVQATVASNGAKAEQRIREMNAVNRLMDPAMAAIPNTTPPQRAA